MTTSQTIKNLRKKVLRLSQEAFAERLGVNPKTVGFWESGMNEPNKSNLLSICNEFNLPENYFSENVRKVTNDEVISDDCISIDYIHINPSCGRGTVVLDEAEVTPIKLGTQMIQSVMKVSDVKKLKIFKASGDSMESIIEDGDLLLVDTGRVDFNNGGVFLLTIDNEWYVKRLRKRLSGELDVISDNIKYPIETFKPDSPLEIVVRGKVVKNLSRGL